MPRADRNARSNSHNRTPLTRQRDLSDAGCREPCFRKPRRSPPGTKARVTSGRCLEAGGSCSSCDPSRKCKSRSVTGALLRFLRGVNSFGYHRAAVPHRGATKRCTRWIHAARLKHPRRARFILRAYSTDSRTHTRTYVRTYVYTLEEENEGEQMKAGTRRAYLLVRAYPSYLDSFRCKILSGISPRLLLAKLASLSLSLCPLSIFPFLIVVPLGPSPSSSTLALLHLCVDSISFRCFVRSYSLASSRVHRSSELFHRA